MRVTYINIGRVGNDFLNIVLHLVAYFRNFCLSQTHFVPFANNSSNLALYSATVLIQIKFGGFTQNLLGLVRLQRISVTHHYPNKMKLWRAYVRKLYWRLHMSAKCH